ncbi:MAG: ATP-binding protein [Lachnospiraceae bacterium]|nr:ATP-binding protein [Lachnospiraceae bacterium]
MIKRSLKRQFTLIFVAIFAALLVLLFGLNKFFLQNYYLTEKVKMMDLAYMTIDRAVELAADNNETLFDLINEEYDKNIEDSPTVAIFRTLNERSNIDIAMMSSDRTMSAATSREANWLMNKLNVYMDVFDRSLSVPDVEAFAENEEENAESAAAQNDMPEEAVNEDGSAAVNETENSEMSESFDGENDSNDNSDAYPTQSSEIDTEATASDNESSVIDETMTAETESASEDKPLDSKAESIMESIYSSIQSTKEKSSLFSFKEDDSHYKVLKQNDNYITQRIFDWRSGTTYIECFGVFSDGDTFFLMSMPLANIKECVKLTLKFTFFSGLMILIIGSVIFYVAADRLTRPVNKLAKLSDKMAGLDFSEHYEGTQINEIGLLGKSMNKMSDKLDSSIKELKEANMKLQSDIIEKTRVDEARKEFIANVTHELKTPIALIEGYAEGLVEGIAEDKDSRDYYCGVIMDESVKMDKMVRQLISLISYEFGSNKIDRAEFNICALIRSVTESLKLKLNEKDAIVHLMLPDNITVNADEFKIEEVYTNYLNNAINHLDGEKNIIVRIDDEPDKVTVYVYNDGRQIHDDSLPHLWEKFYKVDKARTRAYGGSGIGLSIVKAIMEAHGGGYGVRNTDQGVEFYFSLKKC